MTVFSSEWNPHRWPQLIIHRPADGVIWNRFFFTLLGAMRRCQRDPCIPRLFISWELWQPPALAHYSQQWFKKTISRVVLKADELPCVMLTTLCRILIVIACRWKPVYPFFYQGQKTQALALRIVSSSFFLPEGSPAFDASLRWKRYLATFLNRLFGSLGLQDNSQYFGDLFIKWTYRPVINQGVWTPYFEVSRYGEALARPNPSFDNLLRPVSGEPSLAPNSGTISRQYLWRNATQPVVALYRALPRKYFGRAAYCATL